MSKEALSVEGSTERQQSRQNHADNNNSDTRKKRNERLRKKTLKMKDKKIADLKKKLDKYKKTTVETGKNKKGSRVRYT